MRQESEILFKCRGQYIGGGKLLNRRNTLDIRGMIFTDIFTLNRGWPSRETDASATTG